MVRVCWLCIISFLFITCNSVNKSYRESLATLNLRNSINRISHEAILFGHQDDLAYGIDWKGIKNESDVKRVAGDYPALFGWELGNIGDTANIDGVPFDSIVVYIKRAHQMGGINTISWHARNPVSKTDSWSRDKVDITSLLPKGQNHHLLIDKLDLIASFISELKSDDGELIPIIFRPWHEMNGKWFWWGIASTTNDEYIKLFRFTVKYLREEKKLNNLLIAFSPDANALSRENYLVRYPGDEYVDILGLDDYIDFTINRLDKVVQKISIVVDLATEKNKIAALTETGSDKLSIPNWYTTNLLQVLKANDKTRSIAYVLVWRNRDEGHFYVPPKNHEQANDFISFVNDELVFLLNDYNQIKNPAKIH